MARVSVRKPLLLMASIAAGAVLVWALVHARGGREPLGGKLEPSSSAKNKPVDGSPGASSFPATNVAPRESVEADASKQPSIPPDTLAEKPELDGPATSEGGIQATPAEKFEGATPSELKQAFDALASATVDLTQSAFDTEWSTGNYTVEFLGVNEVRKPAYPEEVAQLRFPEGGTKRPEGLIEINVVTLRPESHPDLFRMYSELTWLKERLAEDP